MPSTAVETAVCDICGVEVRKGSLFCYNCGGSVSKASDAEPIPAPVEEVAPPPAQVNGNLRGINYEPAKRRSERTERRKVKAASRQPVEIVWEPRTGFSWSFVISAAVFLLIALVVVLWAYYLK